MALACKFEFGKRYFHDLLQLSIKSDSLQCRSSRLQTNTENAFASMFRAVTPTRFVGNVGGSYVVNLDNIPFEATSQFPGDLVEDDVKLAALFFIKLSKNP